MTDPLRSKLVDFDQGVTDSAVSAFDDGGVNAWWNRNQDGGFAIVAGRQACVLDGGLLGIPPIIVRDDRSSVAVVQLKERVRQWEARIEDGRYKMADRKSRFGFLLVLLLLLDGMRIDHEHEHDYDGGMRPRLWYVIGLNQSDAGAAVFAADNCGVSAAK